MTDKPVQRKTYLDILRLTASFLVCFNHSDGFGQYLGMNADGGPASVLAVIFPVVTTVNIPLFFMISGALLLPKEESYKTLLTKRVGRFVILLVSASTVTYLFRNQGAVSVSGFLYALFGGTVSESYWYLYAYLSFLLALPFLRKIAKNLSHQDFFLLVLLRFLFITVYHIAKYWIRYWGFPAFTLSGYLLAVLSVYEYLFFPLVGYYLACVLPMDKVTGKHLLGCAAVFVGGSAVSAAMTYVEGMHTAFSQNYIGLFNYSSAIAIFVAVRYVTERHPIPAKVCSLLSGAGSAVIGIYLLEPIITDCLYVPFFRLAYWHPVTLIIHSGLWCIICMVLGGTLTWLLRKIPGVRKIL